MFRRNQSADEILKQGAAERRKWIPNSDSAHYRIYRWWATKKGKSLTRINFCVYFWVVVLWAPLLWLKRPLQIAVAVAFLGLVVWFALAFTDTFVGMVASGLIALYVACGLTVFGQLLADMKIEGCASLRVSGLADRTVTVRALCVFLTLPVVLVFTVLMTIVVTLIVIIGGIHDDYDGYGKVWRWFTSARLGKSKLLAWVRPWSVALITAVIYLGFFGLPPFIPVWLVILAGIVVFAVAVVLLASYLVDLYREKNRRHEAEERERRLKRAADPLLRRMFDSIHPVWVGNESKYAAWRARYNQYCIKAHGAPDFELAEWYHIDRLTKAQMTRYRELLSAYYESKSVEFDDLEEITIKRPSKFSLAFGTAVNGVFDYLELIWSVLLTKKWKICPWVDLPD